MTPTPREMTRCENICSRGVRGGGKGSKMAGLELRKVRKSFGSVDVIHDVDLTVDDGEFTVFVGPSGCGKSTLLRACRGSRGLRPAERWKSAEPM